MSYENQSGVVEEKVSSRRSAILLGGAALAGLALGTKAFAQAAVTDADILNFALNLEFLEAQFYTIATTGMTLEQAGITTKGGDGTAGGAVTVKDGAKVAFTTPLLQQFAGEVAKDEQNHVKFLQSQLANAAVAQPPLDLIQLQCARNGCWTRSDLRPLCQRDQLFVGSVHL